MNIKAVILDMNGVIIADEQYHKSAWKKILKIKNIDLTDEQYKVKMSGKTEKEALKGLISNLSESELEKLLEKRLDIVIEEYKPHMSLSSGLKNFLEETKSKNIPIGVATSIRRRYVNFITDGLEIRKYFKVILSAEDITRGKPDPEIYLKTAEHLHVDPKNCVVVEDSLLGVEAAKKAGMFVIGITTTHSKEKFSTADKVIDSFENLHLSSLK